MTTILQISDTHILPEGPLVSNVLDTASSLEKLIIRINQLRVKHNDIECILVSGDISEDGSSDSYQRFKSIMSLLELPVYVIPGNHDARENMREAFIAENIFTKTGPLNWHKKIGHINLIGLDTLVEGQGGGYLIPESLEYLEKTLNNIKSEPTMLALHHPPFETGIQFMDSIGLENTNEFKTIISLVVMPSALKAAMMSERTFCMRRLLTLTWAGWTCLNQSRRKIVDAGIISSGKLNQAATVLMADAISRRRGNDKVSLSQISCCNSAKLISDGSAKWLLLLIS